MSVPLSDTRLAEIEVRAAHLADYVVMPDEAETLAGLDVPALLAEITRLRAVVADHQGEVIRYDADHERLSAELRDRRTEDLNLRGLLAPNGLPRRVPMELGDSLAPAVEWLLAELAGLRACDCYPDPLDHEGHCPIYRATISINEES